FLAIVLAFIQHRQRQASKHPPDIFEIQSVLAPARYPLGWVIGGPHSRDLCTFLKLAETGHPEQWTPAQATDDAKSILTANLLQGHLIQVETSQLQERIPAVSLYHDTFARCCEQITCTNDIDQVWMSVIHPQSLGPLRFNCVAPRSSRRRRAGSRTISRHSCGSPPRHGPAPNPCCHARAHGERRVAQGPPEWTRTSPAIGDTRQAPSRRMSFRPIARPTDRAA